MIKTYLTKRVKSLFALMCILQLASCDIDYEPAPSEARTAPYQLEHNTIYNDSVLKQVLDEELLLLKGQNNLNILAKNNSGMDIYKSNPKKVYVHYLPWFQSKPHDGYWGQHWTMTNKNPDNIDENGNNEIASYFNPLIGPYSSFDSHLHEYHFLLMKLSGIDGVIFDWYGSRNIHDYGLIKNATEKFIPRLESVDLDFSIMYEDRVAYINNEIEPNSPIEKAKEDFKYIKNTYFKSVNYLTFNDTKLISIFGPHYLTQANDWNQIYDVFSEENKPSLISLWGLKNSLSNHFTGEFLWVAPDHLLAQDYYYSTFAESNEITIGSTYPGFKSFYSEGGWANGSNAWTLPRNNGLTFVETLNNSSYESADFIQIITWNDFGEGTIIEPTKEFGFDYLIMLQEYTGVPYDEEDLATAARLYECRKKYPNNKTAQQLMDRSYLYMKAFNFSRVNQIIQAIYKYFPI